MYDVLFWSLFTANVLLAIYLAVTSRMHAQPWRLFVLGLTSWILVFWLHESTETLVGLVGEANAGHLKSGADLTATTVSAMVGALFSTAITNRAQFLNKKALDTLTQRMTTAEELYRKPAEEIYAKLTDQTHVIPKEEFFRLVEQRKELLLTYRFEMSELENELRKISP
jgi:hypothetical protein